jgi:hypothetical protein
MNTRLIPIDWKSIILADEGEGYSNSFVDPHFKANKNAILDPMIRRNKRVKNWENFIWKRPSEVYGAGNFSLFNDIKPDDIK